MRRSILFTTFTYLVLFSFSSQCFALSLAETSLNLKKGQSEYYSTNQDQRLTVKVQMVGGVTSPGVYHIPDNVTLIEALSLAGGIANGADLSNVIVRRQVGPELKSYHYDLADLLKDTGKPLPTVSNSDIILVPPQTNFLNNNIALIASLVGIISSSLLIYVTVNNLNKK